jgi:hypothetical protein
LTHSLKAPGFNPCAYQVKNWFQVFAFTNSTCTAYNVAHFIQGVLSAHPRAMIEVLRTAGAWRQLLSDDAAFGPAPSPGVTVSAGVTLTEDGINRRDSGTSLAAPTRTGGGDGDDGDGGCGPWARKFGVSSRALSAWLMGAELAAGLYKLDPVYP